MMKRRIWAFIRASVHFVKFLLLLIFILALGGSLLHDLIDSPTQMDPGLIWLVFIVAFALVEYSWRRFFPRNYFKFGIPVLRREFLIFPVENMPAHMVSLPKTLNSKGLLPQIEIQSLSDCEYGLWANAIDSRDRLFRRRIANYSPLTHGFLALDREKHALILRAYLNWFVLPFLVAWFGMASVIPASHLLFKISLIALGALVVLQLYSGEKEQYLRVWDTVRRYTYGEHDMEEMARTLS